MFMTQLTETELPWVTIANKDNFVEVTIAPDISVAPGVYTLRVKSQDANSSLRPILHTYFLFCRMQVGNPDVQIW